MNWFYWLCLISIFAISQDNNKGNINNSSYSNIRKVKATV